MNMRRALKQPCLRMEYGGLLASPVSDPSAAVAAAPQFGPGRVDDTQNAARTERLAMYGRASAATNAMTTTPAPTAAADPGRRDRMLGAIGRQQTYQPMNAMPAGLSLRDGGAPIQGAGPVPGKGTGDKIPALYEPGEFVVSNAMLKAAPGLRDELHDLRGNVLAAKGMTVQQADAKAVSSSGLRAAGGWGDNDPLKTPGATNGQNQTAVVGAGPTNSGGATGGWGDSPGSGPVAGLQGGTPGPVGLPAAPDYKSPIPGMFPSTSATLRAGAQERADTWGAGKYAKAAGSLATDAVKMPFTIANDVVGGFARGAYGLLRNPTEDFGRGALGLPDREETPNTPAAPVNTAQPAINSVAKLPATGAGAGRGANYSALRTDQTPGATNPSRDFSNELNGARNPLPSDLREGVVHKTVDAQGRVTYSGRNVGQRADGSTQMVDGTGRDLAMRGSLRVSAGAPTFGPNGSYVTDDQAPTGAAKQAAITASLRNPDGSQWTAQDNATMAANLRDGVDKYRGTSRQPAQDSEERIPALGEFGHNKAVATKLARDQLKATLRSQDITSADNRYGHELTAQNNRNRMQYDMNKDQRDYKDVRGDADFTHKQASEKAWSEQIQQAHTSTVDGKPVVDQAGANATMGAMQTMVANQVKALRASGTPEDLRRAKNLADNGVHAIDPAIRGQVIAATKLAAKVNADSSNINPLKPDPLGTVDPMDLMGMKRNSSGDWITRNGKVIPGRYLSKEGADRFLGTPTNEFDILKGQ